MAKKPKSKYPSYPGSGWDYGCKMVAAQKLIPPNKCICIYCHCQAVFEAHLIHSSDCPVEKHKEDN